MASPRIFSVAPLTAHSTIELDESAQRHVRQVLRLKNGHSITLFDGNGGEFSALIEQVTRRTVSVSILQQHHSERESPLSIHLLQGISKGERMDFAIQKAVETGATAITPLFCERSVVKLEPKRLQKRHSHWRGVMISACEQCGRNQVPTLHPPTKLQQQLSHYPTESHHTGFVLDPTAELRCSDFPTPDHNLALLVGPEGGLTTDEIERAEQHGFRRVHLGPRILRTETATVVAITTLQTLWGDL